MTSPIPPWLNSPTPMYHIPPGGVDRVPEYDPRSGEHFWTAIVMFRIADPGKAHRSPEPVIMDRENLVLVGPIGCYFCEKLYVKGMEHRRCSGGSKDE